jgi:hypothetical protein
MPKIKNVLRPPAAGVMAVLTLASLGLAACGGSSGSTASQTNAAATSTSASTPATGGPTASTGSAPGKGPGTGAGRGRFLALRECLQKNGVTLPAPASGPGHRGGGFLGALLGGRLPKGVTHAQLQAAFRKCGARGFGSPVGGPTSGRVGGPGLNRVPAFRKALATYAACLRRNGVNVPAPNTSRKGPVFSTKGVNTNSPRFKSATVKCRGVLLSAFGARR